MLSQQFGLDLDPWKELLKVLILKAVDEEEAERKSKPVDPTSGSTPTTPIQGEPKADTPCPIEDAATATDKCPTGPLGVETTPGNSECKEHVPEERPEEKRKEEADTEVEEPKSGAIEMEPPASPVPPRSPEWRDMPDLLSPLPATPEGPRAPTPAKSQDTLAEDQPRQSPRPLVRRIQLGNAPGNNTSQPQKPTTTLDGPQLLRGQDATPQDRGEGWQRPRPLSMGVHRRYEEEACRMDWVFHQGANTTGEDDAGDRESTQGSGPEREEPSNDQDPRTILRDCPSQNHPGSMLDIARRRAAEERSTHTVFRHMPRPGTVRRVETVVLADGARFTLETTTHFHPDQRDVGTQYSPQ